MPVTPKVDPELVKDWYHLTIGPATTVAAKNKLDWYKNVALKDPAAYKLMVQKVKEGMSAKYGKAAPNKVDSSIVKNWYLITYGKWPTNVQMSKAIETAQSDPVTYQIMCQKVKEDNTADMAPTSTKVDPAVIKKWLTQIQGKEPLPANLKSNIAKAEEEPDYYAKILSQCQKSPAKKPAAPSKNPPLIDPEVVHEWFVLVNGGNPTTAELKKYVGAAKINLGYYQQMVDKVKELGGGSVPGATQPPPTTAVNKPVTKIKKPTFAAQVKALLPATGVKAGMKTIPSDKYDPEQKALYDIIKGLVSKKHKGDTWSGKYDADMKAVSTCVTKAPDAIAFLTRVIKLLDPTWKPWDQKTPMKPGQWAGLNEPDVPYSAKAQGMLPSPESQKKVELLTQKIADYEAEIKRLKDLQRDAESKAGKAEREREKLATADPKLLKYFSYIDKNCSEFLEHVRNTGKLLYRGQKDASLPIFVGYPRADREPKDSDADAQKLADKVMLLTGFKALRSNSIFTSSNIGQADNYGDVYAIFPKNGFQYTWSTKHDDLVINSVGQLTGEDDGDDDNSAEDAYYEYESYFDNMNHLFYSDKTDLLYKIFDYEVKGFNDPDNKVQSQKATALVKAFMAEPMFKVAKKTLDTWDNVDTYDDTVDDVRKAFVDAIKPVLVLGKKYFDIFQSIGDWDKNTIKNAEKDLKEIEGIAAKAAAEKGKLAGNKLAKEKAEAERIIKNFGFTHENFDAALKARHEICILGEYVAVDWGKYEDEIKKYFLRDASDPKKKVAAKKKPAAKKKTGTNAGKPVKQSGAEDPHLPSGLKDSDFEEDPDVGY